MLSIRSWENWYDYPGSYWVGERRSRIDRGEPSRLRYAAHVIIGHHGIFSLSPVWFLSLCGGVWWYRSGRYRLELASIAALTIVCIIFYVLRPQGDRNYGGSCSGLRWMFWLIPMWFFALLPALDRLAAMRGYLDGRIEHATADAGHHCCAGAGAAGERLPRAALVHASSEEAVVWRR